MFNLLKKIKDFIFKDYSTDIALRYLPVVDLLKKNKLANNEILEVGSGDFGITPYLKKKVTGLDITFGSQENDLLEKVKYNGGQFPFTDNEFDIVIGVDSLEHVPKHKRQEFIREMARVAKRTIVVVLPCGTASHKLDKELAEYFYKAHHHHDSYLCEHLENGLPEKEEIKDMLNNAAKTSNKKITIEQSKKLLNVHARKYIMKCKISRNVFLSVLYYLFLLFLPFRKMFNFKDCYWQLFFIRINK